MLIGFSGATNVKMFRGNFLRIALLAFLLINVDAQVVKEWWKHATFYQIYPRSFMDGILNDGMY